MKKTLLTIICTVLVCSCVMGATLAYLVQKTQTITNTFVIGNITIELTETDATDNAQEFKLTPGSTYTKDPTVTVGANSEACWIFVKVVKTDGFDTYVTSSIDSAWQAVPEVSGVYYISVNAETAKNGKSYPVLTGNTVTVNAGLTREQIVDLGESNPKIEFTAYAIQAEGFGSAKLAWDEVSKLG